MAYRGRPLLGINLGHSVGETVGQEELSSPLRLLKTVAPRTLRDLALPASPGCLLIMPPFYLLLKWSHPSLGAPRDLQETGVG